VSDGDICLKFGVWLPWNHPNAAKRQKRKPEVEFRCAGAVYLENETPPSVMILVQNLVCR